MANGDPRRPSFLGRLFPVNPAFEGLFTIEQLRQMQAAQATRAGAAGMAQVAQGRGLAGALAGIGGGLAEWPEQQQAAFEGMARVSAFNQQQEMRANRERIVAQNPKQAGESERDWLARLLQQFMRSGDREMVTSITEIMKSQPTERGERLMSVDAGDKMLLVDPTTGQTVREIPKPAGAAGETGWVIRPIPSPTGPQYARVNTRTGQVVPLGVDAPIPESVQRVTVLADVVADAHEVMESLLPPNRVSDLIARRGLNEFLRANRERMALAALQIADAYARMTTGAAMPESEYERAERMYTPRPGDNAETIEDKRRRRTMLLRAIQRAASRAPASMGSEADEPAAPANPFSQVPMRR